LTLERVILFALILIVAGIACLIWGLEQWADRDFGPLNTSRTLRLMIIAVTALVVGLQLMMSGFMSSMINIPLAERRVIEAPASDPMQRRETGPSRKKKS
jgi:hypothetical protein